MADGRCPIAGPSSLPRTPDRERQSWRLDVHEEREAIRRERRSGEFFVVEAIEREWESRPIFADSDKPLIVVAIGAGERESVRAGRDVVGLIERAPDGEDHNELRGLIDRVVFPDLARMCRSADVLGIFGIRTVSTAAHEPDLALRDRCRAVGLRLFASRGVVVAGIRVRDGDERNGKHAACGLHFGEV